MTPQQARALRYASRALRLFARALEALAEPDQAAPAERPPRPAVVPTDLQRAAAQRSLRSAGLIKTKKNVQ